MISKLKLSGQKSQITQHIVLFFQSVVWRIQIEKFGKVYLINSYSIKSDVDYRQWQEVMNDLAHSAGFKMFGNLDVYLETPEEFDSFDLNREKVIFAQHKVVIFIGPLQPGEYHFFGEYAPNTAQGTVVAIEKEQP